MGSKNTQTTPATTSTFSIRQLLGVADAQTAHPATSSTAPTHQLTGLHERSNNTSRSTGRSGRQNAATRRNMRREERVTVQGPVKKQQPDGMSHRGGAYMGLAPVSWLPHRESAHSLCPRFVAHPTFITASCRVVLSLESTPDFTTPGDTLQAAANSPPSVAPSATSGSLLVLVSSHPVLSASRARGCDLNLAHKGRSSQGLALPSRLIPPPPCGPRPCANPPPPAWTRSVHLDAHGQRHGATAPSPGRPTARSSQTGQVIRGLR